MPSFLDNLLGIHFRYPDHYEVGREKIREYAVAVKNDDPSFFDEKAAAELGYDALLAPLTFISVFGYRAQLAMFHHNNIAITDAKIVPPTSQNQKRIEDDLREFAAQVAAWPLEEATWKCEQAIRNYDPCISCATHFLRLEIDRE